MDPSDSCIMQPSSDRELSMLPMGSGHIGIQNDRSYLIAEDTSVKFRFDI